MAIIAPFRGLTYNYYVRRDFENLIAPPYDVISEQEQEEYYQTDPYNVIRLILAKKKTGDSDWDNRYTRAAETFRRWESADILRRTAKHSMYLTSLTYDPGRGLPRRTRWGFVALVRIEDEGSGVILPHERTFSRHKEDRLKLMRASSAQFSQVFGVYEDPDMPALNACRRAIEGVDPELEFESRDGETHRMWILENPFLFKEVAYVLKDKTIFIADGHHRYETTRNYRDMMRARYGRRPENRSYEFVMIYLTNMSDEGMTILPTHRVITSVPGFDAARFLETMKQWFIVEEMPFGSALDQDCSALRSSLAEKGEENSVFALYPARSEVCHILTLKTGARGEMGGDLHPSLQKLDVLVLSRFALQKGLGFSREDLDDEKLIYYESNMETAVERVQSGEFDVAFLLNPTKISHVKEIAVNGLVMPRKSTFFYPKIPTGLVFNKIDPYEIILTP